MSQMAYTIIEFVGVMILMLQNGQSFIVPKKYYTNYFNPNLSENGFEIYELPYNRMVIKFSGGDATCSFRAALFFKDNKVIKSMVADGD